MKRRQWFWRGMRDGAPIAVSYLAVGFALGIRANAAHLGGMEMALMSFLNVTSAGEAAAIALLGAGTTYVELAFTQLIINLRYLLMSCALSQKIAPKTSVLHRLLVGYGVTDEIFAVSSAQDRFSPYYSYGAMSVAVPGWTLGTALGAVLGNVLPAGVVSAFGVALYGMFLAIILPPARKNRVIAGVVLLSMGASVGLGALVRRLGLDGFTEGFRLIVIIVVISALAAIFFPVSDEAGKEKEAGI